MPIRRKKMDEDDDEGEAGIGADVFHPSNNVIGLGEQLTKSSNTEAAAAVDVGSTTVVDSNGAPSKNHTGVNEVSQMIAVALQHIDTAIAETGRTSPVDNMSSSADIINGNVTKIRNGNNDSELSSTNDRTNNFNQRRHNSEPITGTSLSLSSSGSSSSNSSNSGESTASDLGVILETDELLTPTSPTISLGASSAAGGSAIATTSANIRASETVFNASLTSTVFVQQLALRLAETLNRISTSASSAANGDNDPDAILSSRQSMLPRPDPVVAHVLLRWLRSYDETRSPSPSMSTVSCPEYVELQDKLHRLETDRESLSLQVSVLSDQVGAQSDKIKDLESLLDDKRRKLDSTEEMLQDELSTRSGLETDRLDLLSEISQLKLKLASLERDKISTEHRLHSAQSEIHGLQRVMQDRYNELMAQAQQQHPSRTPQHLPYSNLPAMATKPAASGIDPAGEIEHLRSAVQHLMSENAEKEQRIEQMRMLMERQLLRNTTAPTNGHGGSGRNSDGETGVVAFGHRSGSIGSATMMGTSALPNSASSHFHNQHQQQQHHQHARHAQQQQPLDMDINRQLRQLLAGDDETAAVGGVSTSLPSSASFPESFLYNTRPPPYPVYGQGVGVGASIQSSASYTSNLSSNLSASTAAGQGNNVAAAGNLATWSAPVTPHHQQTNNAILASVPRSSTAARQLAAELNELMPQYRRSPLGFYHTGSLPRGVGQGASPNKKKSDAGLVNSVESDDEGKTSPRQTGDRLKRDKKQKSLKTFISKLKRSNSQEFENGDVGDFRRGGFVRATAGPRLRSWSREPQMQRSVPIRPSVEQFGKWTTEEVADWLNEIGLTMYVADCRKNIRSGRHMMSLTPADMEKELGVKNQLHRKKLIIAMRNIELGKPEPSDQMDYHQVLRWLDDVGLPQYRDVFAEHRIDGALLNLLTVDDLLQMRINSALHHATLARGIQILRIVGFNLNRFIRKFSSDVVGKGPLPNQAQLWSQHCVTEWLRTIDLTEFTPNLMCAGIHGALLVLEPTFTAESLAAVLQIPIQKTLLRRHLTTHFNQLLGQEIVSAKRETLSIPFAVQLVPGLKVKAAKKGFSLARRKHNRTEVYMEPDDLVCPLTPNRKPPSSAALLDRLPESISEQMLHSLSSSNV